MFCTFIHPAQKDWAESVNKCARARIWFTRKEWPEDMIGRFAILFNFHIGLMYICFIYYLSSKHNIKYVHLQSKPSQSKKILYTILIRLLTNEYILNLKDKSYAALSYIYLSMCLYYIIYPNHRNRDYWQWSIGSGAFQKSDGFVLFIVVQVTCPRNVITSCT